MKNKQKPIIICITGKMGSGKSTAARFFHEHFNIPVYNADERAKKLMHQEPLNKQIIKIFGNKSFQNGLLNRKWLAEQVFGNSQLLKNLEQLVHPAVKKDFEQWIDRHKNNKYVILENAVLFKSGMDKFCDWIIYIDADQDLLIDRVKKRDGLPEDQIKARLYHQLSNMKKTKNKLLSIENNNSLDDLLSKIKNIFLKIDDN